MPMLLVILVIVVSPNGQLGVLEDSVWMRKSKTESVAPCMLLIEAASHY